MPAFGHISEFVVEDERISIVAPAQLKVKSFGEQKIIDSIKSAL